MEIDGSFCSCFSFFVKTSDQNLAYEREFREKSCEDEQHSKNCMQ